MATVIARLRHTDEGAELIEMAIVTPLLLLLIMGMVDFGFMFQRLVVLTNAAAEGARVASLPGYTTADVQSRVAAYAAAGGITVADGVVNATRTPTTIITSGGSWPGSVVTVSHVYTLEYIGPIAELFSGGALTDTVTLTTTSTVRHQVAAAP